MKSRSAMNPKVAEARDDDDFFPTQPEITAAFMKAETPILRRRGITTIYEPFCGEGAMSEVIKGFGFRVRSSDLVDRGYGNTGINANSQPFKNGAAIISNPAYKDDIPETFIRHAHSEGAAYIALLLKVQFWNPQKGAALWNRFRPVREYKVAWRPDFLGMGGGQSDFCFWVWEPQLQAKQTTVHILTKCGACL